MDLQTALSAVRDNFTPASPAPKAAASKKSKAPLRLAQARPRRVAVLTWTDGPRVAVFGETDRHSESRPPPELEANHAERFFTDHAAGSKTNYEQHMADLLLLASKTRNKQQLAAFAAVLRTLTPRQLASKLAAFQ